MKNYDVVVVGSGFCGSVIAHQLANQLNKRVLIIEKRNHTSGNMYDYLNEEGILIQKYGPHIFHTNDERVYEFITQVWDFDDYHLKCKVVMDNKSTPSPFNFQTIDDYYDFETAELLKKRIQEYYNGAEKITIVEMLKCTDSLIQSFAQMLYDKDYKLYTAKQWGISPDEIDISVLQRVPVILSYKDGYFDDKYQIMPKKGFHAWLSNMIDNDKIDILTEVDAMNYIELDNERKIVRLKDSDQVIPIVYTGEIDRFFDYEFGSLPYRSLRFEYKTFDMDSYQDAAVTAYPQVSDFTRITEYKKLPVQDIEGKTTIALEYPVHFEKGSEIEPYYPILTKENCEMYSRYLEKSKQYENLFLCGRLADYRYYNMDNAIGRALDVYKILEEYILKNTGE